MRIANVTVISNYQQVIFPHQYLLPGQNSNTQPHNGKANECEIDD